MARVLLALVLTSALLLLSFPQGFGRRVHVLRHYETWSSRFPLHKEDSSIGKEMMETELDYQEPGANTNPRNGALFNSPAPPPIL